MISRKRWYNDAAEDRIERRIRALQSSADGSIEQRQRRILNKVYGNQNRVLAATVSAQRARLRLDTRTSDTKALDGQQFFFILRTKVSFMILNWTMPAFYRYWSTVWWRNADFAMLWSLKEIQWDCRCSTIHVFIHFTEKSKIMLTHYFRFFGSIESNYLNTWPSTIGLLILSSYFMNTIILSIVIPSQGILVVYYN